MSVLVDRIWPRGLTKEHAAVDHWLKDVAQSSALRRWFEHHSKQWTEFRRRYRAELGEKEEETETLLRHADSGCVTLLYGARDEPHDQTVALKEFIEERA